MIDKLNEIMKTMELIEYGFKDKSGYNIINNSKKWDNEFYNFYYMLTPEELLENKCGVCWDQVELERKLLKDNNIDCESYWICYYDNKKLPSHTFITIKAKDEYYWFEHSWYDYKGIHKYNSLNELLKDVRDKFISINQATKEKTLIRKYKKPKEHINCEEFYNYIDTQEKIELKI